jgi:hypothetical protein
MRATSIASPRVFCQIYITACISVKWRNWNPGNPSFFDACPLNCRHELANGQSQGFDKRPNQEWPIGQSEFIRDAKNDVSSRAPCTTAII